MPSHPLSDNDLHSRTYPIQEDMRLQLRLWRLERTAWIVLALIVLLALSGLFGGGPLSSVRTHTPDDSLRVSYERFERNGAATELSVHMRGGSPLWLEIEGDLLTHFTWESIQPQPTLMQSRDTGVRLQLQPDDLGRASLPLSLRPGAIGMARSSLQLNGQRLQLTQLLYP